MKTIFKYKIEREYSPQVMVELPKGFKVLTTESIHGILYLWAEVDTDQEFTSAIFEVFLTGEDMYEGMGIERDYVGTVLTCDGSFVQHVYHRIN